MEMEKTQAMHQSKSDDCLWSDGQSVTRRIGQRSVDILFHRTSECQHNQHSGNCTFTAILNSGAVDFLAHMGKPYFGSFIAGLT